MLLVFARPSIFFKRILDDFLLINGIKWMLATCKKMNDYSMHSNECVIDPTNRLCHIWNVQPSNKGINHPITVQYILVTAEAKSPLALNFIFCG